MNLDILRTEWAARDAKLESALQVNTRVLRELLIAKNDTEIARLLPFGPLQIAFWGGTVIALGHFLFHHVGDLRYFIPALALQAWTIVFGALALHDRLAMRSFDYGQPLVAALKRLEELRLRRVTAFKWAMLTGQLLWWIPFFLVFMKGVFGADLYASEWMRGFMLWNVVVQALFIPVAAFIARWIVARFEHTGVMRSILDGIAGEDVVAARNFLEKLARFEKE